MLALRPACASWMPACAPCPCTNSTIARQHGDVLVLPDPQVVRRNPPLGQHRCRLGHHQPCAAHRPAAQVHQVPVIGKPVHARVLAHRRYGNAVGQRNVSKRNRRKQMAQSYTLDAPPRPSIPQPGRAPHGNRGGRARIAPHHGVVKVLRLATGPWPRGSPGSTYSGAPPRRQSAWTRADSSRRSEDRCGRSSGRHRDHRSGGRIG